MSVLDFLGNAAGVAGNMAGQEVQRNYQREQEQTRQQQQVDMAKLNNDLLAQRQATILAMSNANAEMLRTQKVDRTNATMGDESSGIIGSALKKKYADPVMGDTPLTDEQQSVMDQGIVQQGKDKKSDTDRMRNDPNLRLQAQVQNGDEDPYKAASLDNNRDKAAMSAEIKQAQMALNEAKTAQQIELGYARLEALQAKSEGRAAKDTTNSEMLKSIDADRKEIATKIREGNTALKDLQSLTNMMPEAEKAERIKAAHAEIEASKKEYEQLGTRKQVLYGRLGFGDTGDKPKAEPKDTPKQDGGPVKVTSQAEFQKLPSGTRFTAPDGSVRIKP